MVAKLFGMYVLLKIDSFCPIRKSSKYLEKVACMSAQKGTAEACACDLLFVTMYSNTNVMALVNECALHFNNTHSLATETHENLNWDIDGDINSVIGIASKQDREQEDQHDVRKGTSYAEGERLNLAALWSLQSEWSEKNQSKIQSKFQLGHNFYLPLQITHTPTLEIVKIKCV